MAENFNFETPYKLALFNSYLGFPMVECGSDGNSVGSVLLGDA